jgi:hypothetical protein
MSFVADIELGFDRTPLEENMGGVWYVEFLLGIDLTQDQLILMSVMLYDGGSVLHDAAGTFDLRFGIRTKDPRLTWKIGPPDFSHDAVRRYIAKPDRETVRELVVKAIAGLVSHVNPAQISMSTAECHMPKSAFAKYDAIGTLLKSLGYSLDLSFIDDNGRTHWLFVRMS